MSSTKQLVVFFAIIMFGSSLGTAQEKSRLVIKYDKKSNETTVRLKPFKLSRIIQQDQSAVSVPLHQVDLELSYSFPGEKLTKQITDVDFRFQVSSSNYTFLRSQAVIAVLDNENGKGRAFSLGTTDYKSYPPKFNSLFEETLVVNAPADAITRMAKAVTLQIYLGPVVYSLTEKQLEAIKELAAALQGSVLP